MTTEAIPLSRRKLWLAAIKPPMYSVAVVPIWVGTAIAAHPASTQSTQHSINGWIASTFLLSALSIVAWSNVSNDVYDADTGIDRNKQHSLVNLTGNRPLMFWIGNAFLALGVLGIVAISAMQQDFTVLGLVLACCFLGYLYQGPPFRLGYKGLGEFLCFFAYGPLALSAVYYSQTKSWSPTVLCASVFLGIITSIILFCSHFHQVEDDIAAGKRSPIVRFGTQRGAALLPWLCGGAYGSVLVSVGLGAMPVGALLTFGSLPFAVKLCRFVGQYHDQPQRVNNCKFIAVALHFSSGLLLGLGFLVL
jgi:2-carboxy-1,4-naphthoquinone phytyltransferase